MIATATDLMVEFGASAAFTCRLVCLLKSCSFSHCASAMKLLWSSPRQCQRKDKRLKNLRPRKRRKSLREGGNSILKLLSCMVAEFRRCLVELFKIMLTHSQIVSLTAGYASTCFNQHIREQHYDPTTEAEVCLLFSLAFWGGGEKIKWFLTFYSCSCWPTWLRFGSILILGRSMCHLMPKYL